MSIPPLVCSTPPPPEQCEDDKDHEDFEISYNLSQEDDEDGSEYNYGNYSAYNIYHNKTENIEPNKWSSSFCDVSEPNIGVKNKSDDFSKTDNFISNNELVKENMTTFEESVIEDLNLIIDKNVTNDLGTKEYDIEVDPDSESSENDTKIQDEGGTNNATLESNTDNHVTPLIINLNILNENEIPHDNNEDIASNIIENSTKQSDENLLSHNSDQTESSSNDRITFVDQAIVQNDLFLENQDNHITDLSNEKIKDDSIAIDDFGDFEDFQINTTENNEPLPINNENPWVNTPADTEKSSGFGDFTANFDFEECKSGENIHPVSCKVEEVLNEKQIHEDENDDFDDFEDYRSSDNTTTIVNKTEATLAPDITVWNLHSSENDPHIVDSINTMLTSIFTDILPEPENELLGKLESFLSETWGHLVDIDVRQPYMINWNNSLGQKTLLKALCIDSRNILFGPKWNYNMPKYAANLSAAPLQPKKPSAPLNSSVIDPTEKVTTKDTAGWIDPFTPDGQEYTYAEALLLDLEHLMATLDQMAHKHSTLKISELLSHACHTENQSEATEPAKRPTDLDVLESETSKKLNKIYSSTISVQPLRHINLPDTHIFTPTDSETPRSKTIHYDSRPALSQTVEGNNQDQAEKSKSNSQFSDPVENEYWDFQDFKGTNTVISSTTQEMGNDIKSTSNLTNTGVTYQTQILQPIKLEPIMPTLNWPDPGEVKETFDDFSDFISSTKWGSENDNKTSNLDSQSSKMTHNIPTHKTSEKETVDDEFETFQSAPMSTSVKDSGLSSIGKSPNSMVENSSKNVFENSEDIPVKVDNNSFAKSNNMFTENQCSYTSKNVLSSQDPAIPQTSLLNRTNDVLQPTASTSGVSRNQNKSGQILQPLTLESYSQINWPNPGIDLQDLSRFNPINSLNSLKSDVNSSGNSKSASPAHNSITASNQTADDEIWGDFVSSAPKPQEPSPMKAPTFVDDDEWTDFVSSPNIKPQNGLNTISFNVHTNLSMQKSSNQNKIGPRNNQIPLDIPTLNYITPKSNNRGIYSEKHFQNL